MAVSWKRLGLLVLAPVVGLASLPGAADVEVRVRRSAAGVPQIQVDGQAVLPRMFWGEEGRDPLVADSEWKDFSYAFTVPVDQSGTVHIRFGAGNAGRVELRNPRITDIDTDEDLAAEWTV